MSAECMYVVHGEPCPTGTHGAAPSPAAEPPDGLREELVYALSQGRHLGSRSLADALLAGPLAPLLDRAAKAEAVARVEALADYMSAIGDGRLRRALDG